MKTLVTGGAGFIGSHLVDNLIKLGQEVLVIDNLSSGSMDNLSQHIGNPLFEFRKIDLLDKQHLRDSIHDCDRIFHFAANPEVDSKKASPEDHFRQNIEATYNLLETMRLSKDFQYIVFASSSTVYGEAEIIPTSENYGPLIPISLYGASKLACEGLLSAYASMYGFRTIIYRLANVIGPRSNHGVIYDFIKKLKRNPKTLEVLGDGKQSKSYLYIDDCISGIIKGLETNHQVDIYNIGSEDRVNILQIANIVKEEMGLETSATKLTGGVDGGRGWKGDVKIMQLEMKKLLNQSWLPKYDSSEAVRLTARSIIDSQS